MGDIVMMRVYMAADPAMEGKLDFAGMNAAYAKFFGTSEQPNKPARSTVQVAALVAAGALVEIEVQAARGKVRGAMDGATFRTFAGGTVAAALVAWSAAWWRRAGRLRARRGRLYGAAGDRRQGRLREELRLVPYA